MEALRAAQPTMAVIVLLSGKIYPPGGVTSLLTVTGWFGLASPGGVYFLGGIHAGKKDGVRCLAFLESD